jgi:uncharacterized protein YodC (DUF2158 family)
MAKFEPGDTVRLKSGGPKMTIDSVSTGNAWGGDVDVPVYTCSWFRGATRNQEKFKESSLTEADDDEESG